MPTDVLDSAFVARALREIALYLQLKGENAFKVRAYDLAAGRVLAVGERLAEVVREGRLAELPNIGPALAERIVALHTTGTLPLWDELRAAYPPGILALLELPDLGPRKVATLWTSLGVGSVGALEEALRQGRVRTLKGFGEKSEARLLTGLEQYRAAHARRRLGEVLPLATALREELRRAPGVVRIEVAGSIRRFCETVSDVDLIASAAESAPVLEVLAHRRGVAAVLAKGDSKCSVRLDDGLQVDLRVLPDEDFATALHHFTGSKAHHVRLRGRARDLGLTISEWGVFRGEQKLAVPDEPALYRLLGMGYVPAELREDNGEFEAALAGTLPADLVEPRDVVGAVHAHTTWSDGRASLLDMARAAAARGLAYLTITDHSGAAGYASGLSPDRLRSQWKELEAVQAQVPEVRLLRGLEVDILQDGALDLPDALLQQLDIVIASVHVRHGQDVEAMTARVLRALDHPCTDVLGHPTGRLLQRREPAPLRMDEIFARAAERGVALEVNGNPDRLDLHAAHVRTALQAGCQLVASVDAHDTESLDNVLYAARTARKGGARRQDVLNTLGVESFLLALRERHPRHRHP
ncbi:MAG: DNA polymerase/3'-5' exonuclease PolX [Myxococcaceae bacterium]